ncbi:MAG: hypothetical protein EOO65_05555 [Methanosarcinales archaeon]|nr:MAG: hypothetical protein EOO65_05555 [Methanosarcinales archaeon]
MVLFCVFNVDTGGNVESAGSSVVRDSLPALAPTLSQHASASAPTPPTSQATMATAQSMIESGATLQAVGEDVLFLAFCV